MSSMTMERLSSMLKAVTMTTEKKVNEPCVHGVLYEQRVRDPLTGLNTSGRTMAWRFKTPITDREWHHMKIRILDIIRPIARCLPADFEADFDNKTKAIRWILSERNQP